MKKLRKIIIKTEQFEHIVSAERDFGICDQKPLIIIKIFSDLNYIYILYKFV